MKSLSVQMFKALSMVALLIASATFVACSSDETFIDEPQQPIANGTKYTMTVQASKGGEEANVKACTRALSLDGSTLNATWAEGERVTVYNVTRSADLGGYLEAQSSGANTTLKGDLTGTIEKDDVLTLKFLSPSYASQNGTLEYIAANCDYAEATVTVASVSTGNNITTTDPADFTNQQAIVKFTLMKKADDSAVEIPAATALTVNDGTNTYTVTPASATDVLFVAIPATNTVHLSTSFSGFTYSYDKTATDLLTAGQYYEIGVKMWREVNLAGISSNTTLINGDKVIGTIGGNYKISIANGATVNLYNATITYASNGADYAGLTCLGDATIVLGDGTTNTVVGGLDGYGASNWPGIFVPAGSTLTINGNTGVLNARRGGDDTTNGSPAGIGAGWRNPCGNIVINGGVINAEGGAKAAGIGGCCWRGCGDITINGGTVTATGHKWGTGIGLGGTENANSFTELNGGKITINGGTVIATGGQYGAGIGTGSAEHKDGGTMTIELEDILICGGNVTATGGQYGAGIGIGNSEVDNINKCGTITIKGGTVTATGGEKAAGIGCGRKNQGNNNSECGAIRIEGGTVIATGGAQAAGIGCGYHDVYGNSGDLICGDITIESSVTRVTATKGSDADNCIGVNKTTNRTTCTRVTIGGTLYWGPAGATYYYANGGDTYLTNSPLVYPTP